VETFLNTKQLRDLIIVPTLMEMGPEFQSPYAVALLLGTAAQESHLGEYIALLGVGPALGIYQMVPATYLDIWENFILYRPELRRMIVRMAELVAFKSWRPPGIDDAIRVPIEPDPRRMIWDLRFATIMARLHYYRVPEPLPREKEGYAAYWKQFYNTELGAGTEAEFLHNWQKFC
jgi:hypothetical protein